MDIEHVPRSNSDLADYLSSEQSIIHQVLKINGEFVSTNLNMIKNSVSKPICSSYRRTKVSNQNERNCHVTPHFLIKREEAQINASLHGKRASFVMRFVKRLLGLIQKRTIVQSVPREKVIKSVITETKFVPLPEFWEPNG